MPMHSTVAAAAKPRGLALILGRGRLTFTLGFCVVLGLVVGLGWENGMMSAVIRVVILGLTAMLVFGLFELWPVRLPRWLARWVTQVAGVAIAMPLTTFAIYALSTHAGAPPFWRVPDRMNGFLTLCMLAFLLAPWTALAVLMRQKDSLARHQALAFALERSELERRALDARLHLLQAQVAPHFLFNTLANVQALVDMGSPQAAAVLRSLVAYLRAAVPRLDAPATTLGQEVLLVRAYLELMHMRMPDRLQFALGIEAGSGDLLCPPTTLLTLVENAVRHGIDPSEDGGRIEVEIAHGGGRCRIRVSDTGAGLDAAGATDKGLGTGLTTLAERLRLVFGGDAHLGLRAIAPRGVCAELDFPAQRAPE